MTSLSQSPFLWPIEVPIQTCPAMLDLNTPLKNLLESLIPIYPWLKQGKVAQFETSLMLSFIIQRKDIDNHIHVKVHEDNYLSA